MKEVILITGASSGFGALTARALAGAGHTVYASMLDPSGRNAKQVKELEQFAKDRALNLCAVELDVTSEKSANKAVESILKDQGRLDVIVHNAGHMAYGPAEAFTTEQFSELYDINVLGTQRVNRAALPYLRKQGRGLLIWVGSTSTRGGTPPYLAPYFAAKAAMDSLAVSYAGEVSRWGIETCIVVPGAFTIGTNHFANARKPEDSKRLAAYEAGPYKGFGESTSKALAASVPPDADVAEVARVITRVVGLPFGKRPYRVYVDPAQDGGEIVGVVADRIREEFLRRIGLQDLLTPAVHPRP